MPVSEAQAMKIQAIHDVYVDDYKKLFDIMRMNIVDGAKPDTAIAKFDNATAQLDAAYVLAMTEIQKGK